MRVLVVGGGPAGLHAACAAAEAGAQVTLLDAMAAPGGRIWAGTGLQARRDALVQRAERAGVERRGSARVVAVDRGRVLMERLHADAASSADWLPHDRLVIATGARELQLPFPGWTEPGVVAAGGLQLMLKSGLDLRGRRVMFAGSGPLLPAAASAAHGAGAEVVRIAEQAPAPRIARFALALLRHPDRLAQSLALGVGCVAAGVPYRTGMRLVDAQPQGAGLRVRCVDRRGREEAIDCDLLAVSHGLLPELQLPALLGCALQPWGVQVDELGATTVAGVFAAGEATGIGGVAKAEAEGRVAGLAAAGRSEDARRCARALKRERAWAGALHRAFDPRPDESPRPGDDTFVCRCEDVRWRDVAACGSWREARLQTRCGMGHCQGRLCGAALALHRGWTANDPRPPLVPARVATLARLGFD